MIRFRPLSPDDFPLLLSWLGRPHVRQWWDDGDDTLEKVAAHYSGEAETIRRFLAVLDGKSVGYFQYERLASGRIGTDQFLADAERLSKGLGSRCLEVFVRLIREREAPLTISVDPDPANARAIRCYTKCGFVHDPSRSSAAVHYMTRAM